MTCERYVHGRCALQVAVQEVRVELRRWRRHATVPLLDDGAQSSASKRVKELQQGIQVCYQHGRDSPFASAWLVGCDAKSATQEEAAFYDAMGTETRLVYYYSGKNGSRCTAKRTTILQMVLSVPISDASVTSKRTCSYSWRLVQERSLTRRRTRSLGSKFFLPFIELRTKLLDVKPKRKHRQASFIACSRVRRGLACFSNIPCTTGRQNIAEAAAAVVSSELK
ncbi:hypothetical protein MPSEU_000024600 [Mayamaea pseudoterrestris]|nr:hypothetical protein MPSEU_000024600 [Mayamaea pseudoterrestris]